MNAWPEPTSPVPKFWPSEKDVEIEKWQESLDRSETRPQVEAFSGYEIYNERDPQIGRNSIMVTCSGSTLAGISSTDLPPVAKCRRHAPEKKRPSKRWPRPGLTWRLKCVPPFLIFSKADQVLQSETKNVQTADESLEIAKANVAPAWGRSSTPCKRRRTSLERGRSD